MNYTTMSVTSQHSDLGDVQLHYLRAGRGKRETVLLIHGWPQTSQAWLKVLPLLADYDVVIPDLRGLGKSSIPQGGYDKKTVAHDLQRLVVDVLGIDRLFVVGHDWGGVVAIFLAAGLGARCLGLTVLDVTMPGSPSTNFGQSGKRWHHAFHQVAELPEVLINGRETAYYTWFFRNFASAQNVIEQTGIDAYIGAYSEPGRLSAGLAYYRAIPEDVKNAQEIENEPLKIPVLALGGSDAFGRGTEPAESLADYAEDVQGGVIDNCGHWIPEEQPAALAEKLNDFFEYCRQGRCELTPPALV